MKFIKSLLFIASATFIFSNIGCEEAETQVLEETNLDSLLIESRSLDPECSICSNITIAHCCCFVENVEFSVPSLRLHICGVIGNNYGMNAESCSMFIQDGEPCTQVNNMGVAQVVPQNGRLYFCIAQNAPFSIYNANGSGDGKIRVGCSGSYMPAGSIGTNLSYSNGSYARYFTTSGCTVEFPCDY